MSIKIDVASFFVLTALFVTSNGFPDQCTWCSIEMQNRVGQIEAMVETMGARTESQSSAFMQEMTSLQQDALGIKTALTRVARDLLVANESINRLQDIDQDVVHLRGRVTEVQKHVTDSVDHVLMEVKASTAKLENEKQAQANVINLLDSQVMELKDLMQATSDQVTQQQQLLSALEKRVEGLQEVHGSGSAGSLEPLGRTVTEMQQAFDRYQAEEEKKFMSLRNTIEEMRRDAKFSEFYPGHD